MIGFRPYRWMITGLRKNGKTIVLKSYVDYFGMEAVIEGFHRAGWDVELNFSLFADGYAMNDKASRLGRIKKPHYIVDGHPIRQKWR